MQQKQLSPLDCGRVLVTGARGFIGQHLCPLLEDLGFEVIRTSREAVRAPGWVAVPDLATSFDWRPILAGIDTVIHLSGRVHIMGDDAPDRLDTYLDHNFHGTMRLATQAAAAGVSRFVFLSSIKAAPFDGLPDSLVPSGGSGRSARTPAQATQDPYGWSKWLAEVSLAELCKRESRDLWIIRPPLVYGPGVRANFLAMMRAIDRGIPLPLGRIHNRRSMIYVGNLVSLIATCATARADGGTPLTPSDGAAVSTTDLLRQLAKAMEKPCRLVPVPAPWLRLAGRLIGRGAEIDRLTASLEADSSPIATRLAWSPPYSMYEGLLATAAWYASEETAMSSKDKSSRSRKGAEVMA